MARLELELAVTPLPSAAASAGATVCEVLLAFLKHATGHYRRADGSTTNEFDEYKLVCRQIRQLYGDRPAAEFGSLSLKAVRQQFIAPGDETRVGLKPVTRRVWWLEGCRPRSGGRTTSVITAACRPHRRVTPPAAPRA